MTEKLKVPASVDPEEIERFSRIAEEWWDERGKFRPLHMINPVRLAYLRAQMTQHFSCDVGQMAPLQGLSLLDIGCGGGLISEPMARLGAHVTGIDASQKNISVASLHASKMGLSVDYRATTAEQLRSDGASFDIVLALEIVEHVADVAYFLENVAALVRPGGMLVMSTLNRTLKSLVMAKFGAEYILRWLPVGTHDWNKFLRPSELVQPLEAQGLKLIDLSGMVFSPLKNSWRIEASDLEVNYLASFRKPE
jgi:2-polyprenyl-6-hydroxyphenyl methylase/3-demethylubiquinone-9 3-methyltransferase